MQLVRMRQVNAARTPPEARKLVLVLGVFARVWTHVCTRNKSMAMNRSQVPALQLNQLL